MYGVSQPQLQQGGGASAGSDQQLQQRLKQQQALMQQAMLQQQQGLYHPALLAPLSQIEPIPSGNLPPGFDSSSCRSVYVGNIHVNVTESLLAEVFGSIGPLEGCKLIRKDKSSYGFVDYFDHRSAANSILTLNGRHIFGQPIKVNWAYASGQREDTSGHYSIFVGDLSSEVTDAALFACFAVYPSCSDARVMWDQKSGRSRGFGFVSFRNQQDADNAINQMNGKTLGSRQIRCNWATKTSTGNQNDDKQNGETANGAASNSGDATAVSGQTKSGGPSSGPENNPQYTTVYIGNLSSEVTQSELHRQFLQLGVGIIEDVRVQRDKGFGFVRYRTHEEAALAIQLGNGRIICGKSIKCSWGSKPTPPGATSNLPSASAAYQGVVAAPGVNQGYTAADILAYRQLSQAGAGQPLLPLSAQQGMGLGPMGMIGAAGNQGVYDTAAAAAAAMRQQLMYYQ
uniref:RRM domain-containing protein n=1 Tax=Araucaria cunninghamii TaxID=56994 RepID=A0A0D6R7Y3_ARACU